jgi:amino acid adenylation domain-containing protein/non-ribosomal peptide synthase protein (TIGR01720 family)
MKQLLEKLKEHQISISVQDGNLKLKYNGVSLPDELVKEIKANKDSLIDYLNGLSRHVSQTVIEPAPAQDSYILSSSQKRIWIMSQFDSGSEAYNISSAYAFRGDLNIPVFEQAFVDLIGRHEILRTVFRTIGDAEVRQYILDSEQLDFKLSFQDLSKEFSSVDEIDEVIREEMRVPFDLEKGPLLKATLLQIESDKWIFGFTIHHIISDGWSLEVLVNELLARYKAYCEGQKSPFQSLGIQYKDYSVWQQEELKSPAFKEYKDFWMKSFSGDVPVLELPLDRKRPLVKTFNGARVTRHVSDETGKQFVKRCRELGGTLFIGAQALVKALLYKYSGQDDLIVGSSIAGRENMELEEQIGFYVNELALRTKFQGIDSLSTLFDKVKNNTLEAYENQLYPFNELVNDLKLSRDISRNPLFDVMVDLESDNLTGNKEPVAFSGIEVERYGDDSTVTSKFDLTFTFSDSDEGLGFSIVYNTDLFNSSTAERLAAHLERLMEFFITNPERSLDTLLLLSDDETTRVIKDFNHGLPQKVKGGTVLELFEEQVLHAPDKMALFFDGKSYSYRELNEKAGQVACYLINTYHLQADACVAILLDRGEWSLISILAVLKAGAAYVPIDSSYPEERKQFILQDSRAEVLITQSDYIFDFDGYSGGIFAIDIQLNALEVLPAKLDRSISSTDLAYLIYTSGSTGNPKGVMINHGGLYFSTVERFKVYKPISGFLLLSSFSFDSSVAGVFGTLCSGGTLYLTKKIDVSNISVITDLIVNKQISHLLTVPSYYNLLLTELEGRNNVLKEVIVAGEVCPNAMVETHFAVKSLSSCDLFNEYGPTECTVWSTFHKYKRGQAPISTIGKPLSTASIYVLDSAHHPVPIGVAGELCIGGLGLARGYFNNQELTEAKFILDPFIPGGRMYLSGDLARWLPDGNLEFLGRKDDQVKINGYRIEIGEIQNVLLKQPQVKEAIVCTKENTNGDTTLVGYLVADSKLGAADIRSFLSESLPQFMIPHHFVFLPEIPLTHNGKVDKRRLPAPQEINVNSEAIAPRNEIERELAELWQTILGHETVGVTDNFFSLGGDSIKSIQLAARMKLKNLEISVTDIFNNPILGELAKRVRQFESQVPQHLVEGPVLLSPIHQLFLSKVHTDIHYYNQAVLLKSSEKLDLAIIDKIIMKLTEHHDGLRIKYNYDGEEWQSENLGLQCDSYSIEEFDLTKEIENEKKIEECCSLIQAGMNLSAGPMMKVGILKMSDCDRLFIAVHHFLIDGVSWRILFEDIALLYRQVKLDIPLQLPLKSNSYKHWMEEVSKHAENGLFKKDKAFWEQQENIVVEKIPCLSIGGSNLIRDIRSVSFQLEKEQASHLSELAVKWLNADLQSILLAGLNVALKECFNLKRIAITLEGHGREELGLKLDIGRTVGWFTSLFPIVLPESSQPDLIRQVLDVKEILRQIPNKGIGYGILQYLTNEGLQTHLDPQITFNYLGEFGGGIANLGGDTAFEFSDENAGSSVSADQERLSLIDITAILVPSGLEISIMFGENHFHLSTIEKLKDYFKHSLNAILTELTGLNKKVKSSSDFTYKGLGLEAIAELEESTGEIEDIYGLSPLQGGLYYHWILDKRSLSYFDQVTYRIKGNLEEELLHKSYQFLCDRHPVLRTFFRNNYDDLLLQVVNKSQTCDFAYEDYTNRELHSRAEAVEAYKESDKERGFDLGSGSQARLSVIRLSQDEYDFIWSFHHILMDGWCIGILNEEFYAIYNFLKKGQPLELLPAAKYSKYIQWLSEVNQVEAKSYWSEYLKGFKAKTGLPHFSQKHDKSFAEAEMAINFMNSDYDMLKRVGITTGVTVNTIIESVWGILLNKYNNSNDVLFGSVVSGRPPEIEGVERMVGLFINTIPVRIEMDDALSFTDLLRKVQTNDTTSKKYHYSQLAEIQAASEVDTDLFDHILVFENYPVIENLKKNLEEQEEALEIVSGKSFELSNFNFSIMIMPLANGLRFNFMYNENCYSPDLIRDVSKQFQRLLIEVATHPDLKIGRVDILASEEKVRLIEEFNNTRVSESHLLNAINLFENQVQMNLDQVALVCGAKTYSYKEVDELANQLGEYLAKKYFIKPNDIVGLMLERSEWIPISILGIMKAGGSFLPIDPDYPKDRKDYMITDSGCKLIIDKAELEKFISSIDEFSKHSKSVKINSSDLAYVIYTSGSTGKPKGVMIPNRGLSNYLEWCCSFYFEGKTEGNFGLFSSLSFDLTITSLFLPLIRGRILQVLSPSSGLSETLLEYVDSPYKLDSIKLTPSHLKILLEGEYDLSSLRKVIVGGEELHSGLVNRFFKRAPYAELFNEYGPTEATVGCVVERVSKLDGKVLIGRPISNAQIFIFSEKGMLQPIGVPGEICIGGSGLALGYLNNEALTNQKFVKNTYGQGSLVYRTGDSGRWLHDGSIECLGRLDDQVKLNGFRIELGEIEAALQAEKGVTSCAVSLINTEGSQVLAAYITGLDLVDTETLRKSLSERLPSYMIPSHFVLIDQLPLTKNGKVDKASLPSPVGSSLIAALDYVAPRNEMEALLVEILEKVLGVEKIGINANYFELGGDSIKSIQIVSRLRTKGYTLKVIDLIETPVISNLSSKVKLLVRKAKQTLPQSGVIALSPVHQLYLEKIRTDIQHFNQSVLLKSNISLSREILVEIFNKLIDHHEALRITFTKEEGNWVQEIKSQQERTFQLEEFDLRSHSDEEASMDEACNKIQAGMNLSSGPLVNLGLFKLQTGDQLLIAIHHFVVDGVSWRILLEDLSLLYTQAANRVPLSLSARTDSYSAWMSNLASFANSSEIDKERTYWKKVIAEKAGAIPYVDLKSSNLVRDVNTVSFSISREIISELSEKVVRYVNSDLQTVLLTGLGLALNKSLGVSKVIVNLEGHGREDLGFNMDLGRTLGWFTSVFPFALHANHLNQRIHSLLSVKDAIQAIPNKGIGYGLLRYLSKEKLESSFTPQITFNYLGEFGTGFSDEKKNEKFEFSDASSGSATSPDQERLSEIDIVAMLLPHGMDVAISYSRGLQDKALMNLIKVTYEESILELVSALSELKSKLSSPGDFTYKGLSQVELMELESSMGNIEDVYPLSPLQSGLFYHWILDKSSYAYFDQVSYSIKGKMDSEVLRKCYQALIDRHPILRTCFTNNYGDILLQIVSESLTAEFNYFDITGESKDFQQRYLQTFKESDKARGFDLEQGSQTRLQVIRLGDSELEFVWSFHHIVMDGWCITILIDEFSAIYRSIEENDELQLAQPPKYVNYIRWLSNLDHSISKSYWSQYLQNYYELASLPGKKYTGDTVQDDQSCVLIVDGERFKSFKDVGIRHGLTTNTLIQGLWGVLLSKYNNRQDVVFGSVVSGRPPELESIEEMVGLFINTVPVRVTYGNESSLISVVTDLQKRDLLGKEYHYTQLAEVQSACELGANLFDHIIVFENFPLGDKIKESIEESSFEVLSSETFETNNYNFNILVVPLETSLEVKFKFNENAFDKIFIERVFSHFNYLISSLIENENKLVKQLDFNVQIDTKTISEISDELLNEKNSSSHVISLFEEVVLLHGDSKALVFEGGALTYLELNSLSNRLSAYLVRVYGLKGNALVGISLERTEWLIVAILGVLKSGYAYVPMDPEYPQERIKHMLSDSGCEVVIDRAFADKFKMELSGCSEENPVRAYSQTDLAYVIYTSGSTGLPKGVMIEHRGLLNTIEAQKSIFGVSTGDHHLQFASASFDASVSEIFCSLLSGGVLYMVSETVKKSPDLFEDYVVFNCISLATLPPSYLQLLDMKKLSSLKTLVSAGEAADVRSAIAFTSYGRYVNAYGPTETSICATTYTLEQGSGSAFRGSSVPIGSPIEHVEVCILDGNDQLLPVGLSGELCIGGAGLARGYLNNEALTNSKFVAHPNKSGGRLYRTGDLARWQSEGVLEYIGRVDDQIKIHGYRIEPGEIESILQGYRGVKSSVVMMVELEGEKSLVGYLIGSDLEDSTSLRSYLGNYLPAYMIPSHFVVLEQFPVTANGKIDKKRIPAPQSLSLASGMVYVGPRNAIESTLVQIWESVLGKERVSVKDNFFELGGDSIKSIQVVSRLRPMGYILKVVDLIETPVLESLSLKVSLLQEGEKSQHSVQGSIALSPIQRVYFERFKTDRHHNNHSVLLKSRDRLDRWVVEKVFKKLLEHHDALRMVYREDSGLWHQENKGVYEGMFNLMEFDFRGVSGGIDQIGQACDEVQSGMNLSQGPLVGVGIIRLDDGDRLLIAIHHLVTDGISWRILFEDIALLYNQVKQNKLMSLPQKTDSYRAWMLKQQKYAEGLRLQRERSYWSSMDLLISERLPIGDKEGRNLVKDTRTVSFSISRDQVNSLAEQSMKVLGTDIQSILLSGLMHGLHKSLGVNQVAVTLEGHGREDLGLGIDLGRTVGWFTSMFPVVLEVSKDKGILQDLISVKEALKSIPNKGIGYGQLKYLSEGGLPEGLLPQITFNYLGEFGSGLGSAGGEGVSMFEFSGENQGSAVSRDQERMSEIDVTGILLPEGLEISITYSEHQYKGSDIERIKHEYEQALLSIQSVLSAVKNRIKTGSDFTYKGLRQQEIAELEALSGKVEDVYGLSPLQSGMYYHWMLDKSSYSYFDQVSYRISGQLDEKVLSASYQYLVNRHPVLRTCFKNSYGDALLQVVLEGQEGDFRYKDLSGESKAKQEAYLVDYRERDKQEGFDLGEGSQARLSIVRLNAGEYEFIWSFHHILMDGWCISILNGEFYNIYNSMSKKEPVDLPSVPSYGNYIKWLSELDQQEAKKYWEKYLEDYKHLAGIPKEITGKGESNQMIDHNLELKVQEYAALKKIGVMHSLTINTIIQGLWGVLLGKYNNTTDVVFGSVVSGRPAELEGMEKMVGLFINTVPVRINYSEKDSLLDVLKNLQKTDLEGKNYHYTQLADIQSSNGSGAALLDHILIFENYPMDLKIREGVEEASDGMVVEGTSSFEQTNFDFNITVHPAGEELKIIFVFNAAKYMKDLIEKIAVQFHGLLNKLVADADVKAGDVDILTETDKVHLLKGLNPVAAQVIETETVIEAFEKVVKKSGEKTALVCGDEIWSYKDLNKVANKFGDYLRKNYLLKPDDLVGIRLERSGWLIISILGILKSGAAYLPIDTDYPEERISYLISDSKCKLVVDENLLMAFRAEQESYTERNFKKQAGGSNLAYVIYTSGSTGVPKGVMIENTSLMNYLSWCSSYYFKNGKGGNFGLFTSLSFDLTVTSVFLPLVRGKLLQVMKKTSVLSDSLKDYLDSAYALDSIKLTPSHLQILLEEDIKPETLSTMILGGEEIRPELLSKVWKKMGDINVFNEYGPTEATVGCVVDKMERDNNRIAIGTPIDNTRIYIIGRNGKLLPEGVAGEMCITGTGLARGYMNNSKLTDELFVEDPFSAGGRMYKTGDWGRWLPKGKLEYLGRVDDQVKINGYRIELAEIEKAIQKYSGVESTAVVARKIAGQNSLIAYLKVDAVFSDKDLRQFLSARLPLYMIPNHFIALTQFPLTLNGKVDKKILPLPEDIGMVSGFGYVAPRNEMEEKLALIWKAVLERDSIGVLDNFFEIGGNSIKAILLISRIQREFKVTLQAGAFFVTPTIEEITQEIDRILWANSTPSEMDNDNIEMISI